MLPNDFVVFWEYDPTPSRYVNKFDGSWDLLIKSSGKWELYNNVSDTVAARAFHEAESVYALVDRSHVAIPTGVYWNVEAGNFYNSETRRGMGLSFFGAWQHRSAEFPQCDGFGNQITIKREIE